MTRDVAAIADRLLVDMGASTSRLYFAAVHDLFVAEVTRNRVARRDALDRLAEAMTETMGVAEVLGATSALQDAAKVAASDGAVFENGERVLLWSGTTRDLMTFAATQTVLPRVTLTEAVDDMVARTPVTIRRAAERSAQRIAELYGRGHVVAFAKSAEAAVTMQAREFITTALREGIPAGEAGRALVMSVDEVAKRTAPWSENYARMAFRTNVNTAVTAGRFRQAQDPDIKAVVPAFRFDSVGDADTRDNHDAADDVILAVDNTAWRRLAPPLGYNCRCQVSFVSGPELRAMGRLTPDGQVIESKVPSGAGPDPGFRHGGRPDLFLGAIAQ